jgi:hypothetical protein
VKSDRWPQSFEQFRPLQVGAYPDGISLTLMKDADAEAGLYIIPLHMELVPRARRARLSSSLARACIGSALPILRISSRAVPGSDARAR